LHRPAGKKAVTYPETMDVLALMKKKKQCHYRGAEYISSNAKAKYDKEKYMGCKGRTNTTIVLTGTHICLILEEQETLDVPD
jgi:hypothetical protein